MNMPNEYVAEQPAKGHKSSLDDSEHESDRKDLPPGYSFEGDAGAGRDSETVSAKGRRQKQRFEY